MNNKEIYERILKVLRSKGYYERSIWKYALKHHDEQGIKELLNDERSKNLFEQKVKHLNSNWLELDSFKLLEYHPLVNARAFSLREEKTEILNNAFRDTYLRFL